ncbi:IDEAL domain-containing protein [Neobacillus soli]|uniref:IDEAL domain-containing protein n=1 Tax=Neobacillus soli TaxID=220688 RepID=UPI000824DCD4|nr:IDEAL domain-containing protein [Neobacillus soli]
MKKLLCKYCGNAEFYVVNLHETVCKCGLRLTKLNDYRREGPQHWEDHFFPDQKRQAAVIAKASLLKREIDQCLDERNEERFKKLSLELKVCQKFLKTREADPNHRFKKRLKESSDKV